MSQSENSTAPAGSGPLSPRRQNSILDGTHFARPMSPTGSFRQLGTGGSRTTGNASPTAAGRGAMGSPQGSSLLLPGRQNSIIQSTHYARPMSPTGSFRNMGDSRNRTPRGPAVTKDDEAFGSKLEESVVFEFVEATQSPPPSQSQAPPPSQSQAPPPSSQKSVSPPEKTTNELVKESWDVVCSAYSFKEVGQLFYDALFKKAPALKDTLFGQVDMAMQPVVLIKTIDATVKLLDEPDQLVPVLIQLGERHAGYGSEEAHYAVVGEVFIGVLAAGLGAKFTNQVEQAWVEVYGIIQTRMLEGQNSAKGREIAASRNRDVAPKDEPKEKGAATTRSEPKEKGAATTRSEPKEKDAATTRSEPKEKGAATTRSEPKEKGAATTHGTARNSSPKKDEASPPSQRPAAKRRLADDAEFESSPHGAGGATTSGTSRSRAQQEQPQPRPVVQQPVRKAAAQPARSSPQRGYVQQSVQPSANTPPRRTGSPMRRPQSTPQGPVRTEMTPLVNRTGSPRRSSSPAPSNGGLGSGFMAATTSSSSRTRDSMTVVIDRTTFTPRSGPQLSQEEPEEQRRRMRDVRSFTMSPHSVTPRREGAQSPGVYDKSSGRVKEHHPTSLDYIPLSAYSTFPKSSYNPSPSAWTRNSGHTYDPAPRTAENASVVVKTERPIGEAAVKAQQELSERLSTPKRRATPKRRDSADERTDFNF